MATYVHDNEKADDSPEYLDQVGRGSSDVEEENEYQQTGHGALKLDPAGLPLIPQPTDSTSDVRRGGSRDAVCADFPFCSH